VFIYLKNCFRFPLVSSLLLTGHLPTLSALLFRISLSFFSLLHWNIRFSTVCMGARGGAVLLRHCATSRKDAGSIPDGVIGFFSLT